jgi:hypothetical protein
MHQAEGPELVLALSADQRTMSELENEFGLALRFAKPSGSH